VVRFVERVAATDRVIVVGTAEYRRRYDADERMGAYVVNAEAELIGMRLIKKKGTVLPALLEGDQASSFPALLESLVYADFRDPDAYFTTMLDVVLSLYGIEPRDPVAVELRSLLEGPLAYA
jgi:hypothetical protein